MITTEGNSKTWRPHDRQEEFLSIPQSVFEAFFGGAAGPGKTETLMMLPIVYGFYKHPHFKGIILRRTFPDLEKEIISRSHEYYPLTGAKYNEQKHRWKWPSGAILDFGHAEHDKDIRRYDSAEYNYIGFDELTHFSWFQYSYLAFSRCRSSDPDLPAIVRAASNPGNIGHGWVRDRFIEPCRTGRKIIEELVKDFTGRESKNKRIFIPAYATDNPTLLKNDPGYLARMEMLPEAEKKAKIYGDWYLFSGQVFEEFRAEKLPKEPENALHVIEPFKIPDWYPRIYHLDWGTDSAACAYWGAITPDKRLIVYREYHQYGTKVSDWGNSFRELSTGEDIRRVGMCHSAFANRGEEHTLAEQFAQFSGATPYSSGRDRIGGRYLLHEFLRWKPLERTPLNKDSYDAEVADRLFRFYGPQKYADYLNMFKAPEKETNLPRLQIFNTCQNLIRCIPLCVRDDKNPEDVAEFRGDDPYDSLKGLLKMVDQYVLESKDEYDRLKRIDKAIGHLAASNDQTTFYRTMERLEASEEKTFGVQRHRAGRRMR